MAGADRARGLPTWFLFLAPVLIWASTWHVILYQLASPVPALTSVGWRFLLSALMLAGLARWRGVPLGLPRYAHGYALATGVVQYAGNYWAVYEAERYVPSGLVAVLFCLMVFMNALVAWLLWRQRVGRRFLVASSGAVLGVALIFWPELATTGARPHAALGLGLSFFAVVAAVIGGFCTLVLTRRGLPLLPVLAWSMGYGAAFLLALSVLTGRGLPFDAAWTYVGSLAYLAAFGSVIAFTLYYKLAERRGAAQAALVGVLVPVIALVISALFEGWQATPLAVGGMGLCLASLLVATRSASGAKP
ncbi:DMT family transporter [Roseateles saccharophilus]|uniref:EamA-like transporter family protein n=1 Tax=Roseateles saccharophilus TaxID=304 RepID=A0A4R3VJ86_ROSSA|nr:DMT family transporter [Roseateles saccharophilus]MDG0831331.1 DMT family transporter [Roseateles saccharophilus]TCV04461.1 EamA-like transporter family protein [Roseateles saccharophilus]